MSYVRHEFPIGISNHCYSGHSQEKKKKSILGFYQLISSFPISQNKTKQKKKKKSHTQKLYANQEAKQV